MKSKIGFLMIAGMLVTACSDHGDSVSENEYGRAHAEKELGISISDQHTWNMTTQGTVAFANIPEEYKNAALAVFSQNPLTDTLGTATMLAYVEGQNSIAYEVPGHLKKLYAACILGNGQMVVKPFLKGQETVDMSAEGFKLVSAAESRMTRAGEQSALEFTPTINAMLFAENGWANDRFAFIERGGLNAEFDDFSNYSNSYKTFLPEGKNSTGKLKTYDEIYNFHWTIVGKDGGEVTLIPVHKQSAQYEYLGYFYCLPGEDLNFKDVPKYVFSEGIKNDMIVNDDVDEYVANAYRLIYYDKDGNASYTFPEGTKIYFFLHCFPSRQAYSWCNHSWDNNLGIDYYSMPDLNRDMLQHLNQVHNVNFNLYGGNDDWEESPRVVYFSRGNTNYIGMEDGTDMDYNDIVCMVRGNLEKFPDSETVETKSQVYTYAFEDTKLGDYDMNDVVLHVWRDTKKKAELTVQLVATGAFNNLKVFYDDHGVKYSEPVALFDGKEVHEALGIKAESFGNTETQNVASLPTTNIQYDYAKFRYYKADFYIVDMATGAEVHLPSAQGLVGSAPYAICVPCRWQWPTEHTPITRAYPSFTGYAANPGVNVDWYLQPKGSVFNLK